MACSLSCIPKNQQVFCVCLFRTVSRMCSGASNSLLRVRYQIRRMFICANNPAVTGLSDITREHMHILSLITAKVNPLVWLEDTAWVMTADTLHMSCGCYLHPLFAHSLKHLQVKWEYMLILQSQPHPTPSSSPHRLDWSTEDQKFTANLSCRWTMRAALVWGCFTL